MTSNDKHPSDLGDKTLTRSEFAKYAGGLLIGASAAKVALDHPSLASATGFRRMRFTASQKRTLTIASPYVTSNIEQETNNADQNQQEYTQQVVEPLVEWRKKLRPDGNYDLDFSGYVPVLAESWQILDGGRSIIWHLRPGVKSPAGNELTAEVLKWNYERFFGSKGVGTVFMLLLGIDSPDAVKVLSKYSVKITAKAPTNLWLSVQPQHVPAPLDAVEYKKHATKADPWSLIWGSQNVAGFGPYQIQSRVPGQRAVFIQNPNYWRRSKTFPNFDQLLFEEVPDPTVRLSLIAAGSADIAKSLSFRQLVTVSKNRALRVNDFKRSSNQIAGAFNTLKPPFNDVRVRQAVAWAIPYDQILKSVFYGFASRAYGPLVQFSPTFDKSTWPYTRTDVGKAKALLQAAGQTQGFNTTLKFEIGTPEDEVEGNILKSALAPLGINMSLEKITNAAANQALQNRQFDIALFHGGANDPDPYYSYAIYFLKHSLVNYSGYYNPLVERLSRQGITSQNQRLRTIWSRQIQKQLAHDVPHLWIAEPGVQYPARRNITGMFPRMIREVIYAEVIKK